MRSVIREKNVDGVIVLSVERALKGTGEISLRERIDDLVRDGRLQILIDLRNVPNMDSTELGRLIRAHLSVRQAGGRVRVCNVSAKDPFAAEIHAPGYCSRSILHRGAGAERLRTGER